MRVDFKPEEVTLLYVCQNEKCKEEGKIIIWKLTTLQSDGNPNCGECQEDLTLISAVGIKQNVRPTIKR